MSQNKITITPPDGYEIDKVKSTDTSIVFKKCTEPKKYLTWHDIVTHKMSMNEEQFFLTDNSVIKSYTLSQSNEQSEYDIARNNVNSREQAERILSITQMMTIADHYNDGWKPNWSKPDIKMWYPIMDTADGEIDPTSISRFNHGVIYFKSRELLVLAIKNNKEIFIKYLTGL